MSLRFLIAAALGLAITASPGLAQNPGPRKPDPTAELLAKLRKPITLDRSNEISLMDLATKLTETVGIPILIDDAAFGESSGSLMVKLPSVRGLSLISVLPKILAQANATYLVRKDHLEITSIAAAGRETKNLIENDEDGGPRLAQPLVSMIFQEKPLNEAVADLAEEYNLTVILSPQSGDARTGFVTARLLNLRADKALEMLALQCDLRILPRANGFLITTRDHGNDLLNEVLEHERARIELDKFRATPPAPPQPAPQIQVLPVQVSPPSNPPPPKP